MAIYHLHASFVQRSKGESATAAAAYRAGARIRCERHGVVHDYRAKGGVVHAEVMLPAHAPTAFADRETLWNAAEARGNLWNSQTARDIEVSLPHELTDAERLALVRGFVREQFINDGLGVDVAIHRPDTRGDGRNHHAHLLITKHRFEPGGEWAAHTARDRESDAALEATRAAWADHANRALERAGHEVRIDHRSFADQGIDREPDIKMGKAATQAERRGQPTRIGAERDAIRARNAERADREHQAQILHLDIEQAKRDLRAAARKPDLDPRLRTLLEDQQEAEREARGRFRVESGKRRKAFEGEQKAARTEAARQLAAQERDRIADFDRDARRMRRAAKRDPVKLARLVADKAIALFKPGHVDFLEREKAARRVALNDRLAQEAAAHAKAQDRIHREAKATFERDELLRMRQAEASRSARYEEARDQLALRITREQEMAEEQEREQRGWREELRRIVGEAGRRDGPDRDDDPRPSLRPRGKGGRGGRGGR